MKDVFFDERDLCNGNSIVSVGLIFDVEVMMQFELPLEN